MARKGKKRRFSAGWLPLVALCVLVLAGCGRGGGGDAIEVDATLNGEAVSASDPNDPITVTDTDPTELQLDVENVSGAPVTIRFIRFEGRALDMVFLTYDTAVGIELDSGESRSLSPILFDFFDLGGQASGYLRGNVQLFDEDRELLGSQEVFLDADGEGFSTLSWFNLFLLLATAGGTAWNLMRLAQRRLPPNRFVRALRFLAIGAGAGLTLAVAFSTLRLWPLDTFGWILFTVIGGIAGYVVGFLLPGADDDLMDIIDEADVYEAVADAGDDDTTMGDDRATIKLD